MASAFEPARLYDAIDEENDLPAAPLAGLGISERQLEAGNVATRLGMATPGPVAVRPVTLAGRPHVVTAVEFRGSMQSWTLRPLYLAGSFETKFPGVNISDRPGSMAGDYYLGLSVSVGRQLYVVAPSSEGRRLESKVSE